MYHRDVFQEDEAMECHRNHCLLHLRIVSFQTLLSSGVFLEVNFSLGNKTLAKHFCSPRNQKTKEQSQKRYVGLQTHHLLF